MKPLPLSLICAAWCVVLATVDFHEGWIYQLSKWGLCISSIFLAINYRQRQMPVRAILAGAIAVVFNPISPVDFSWSEWIWVDVISAVLLVGCVLDYSAGRTRTGIKWAVALGVIASVFGGIHHHNVEQVAHAERVRIFNEAEFRRAKTEEEKTRISKIKDQEGDYAEYIARQKWLQSDQKAEMDKYILSTDLEEDQEVNRTYSDTGFIEK